MGVEYLRRSVDGLTYTITPFRWRLGSPDLVNTVLPTLTGTLQPGQVVTGVGGDYDTAVGHDWSHVRFRYRQFNGSTLIASGEGATYTIATAGVTPSMVVIEDVVDTLGQTLATTSIVYAITVTSTAPIFTSQPTLSGTGQINSALTLVAGVATGSPAPVMSNEWEFDTVVRAGLTGLTYYPVTGDLGDGIRCRTKAVNTGGTIYSNYTVTKTVTTAPGNVVTVSNMTDLQAAVNSSTADGAIIKMAPGTYDGTITRTGRSWTSELLITASDLTNPPVMRDRGFQFTNCNRFAIVGLVFENRNLDSGRVQGGLATGTGSAVRLEGCSNYRLTDLKIDRYLDGLKIDNSINATVEYCEITRNGRDNIAAYGNQSGGIFRRILIWNVLIYAPDSGDDDRHPDGIQFAVNGNINNQNAADIPPNTLLIEDCYIENLQDGINGGHGIFGGNAATRPLTTPGGGGFSMTQKAYRNITVRRNYIRTHHQQGICFESVINYLIEGNKLVRAFPTQTTPINTPQIDYLRNMYENVDVLNNVVAIYPSGNQIGVPGGQLTEVGNVPSTTASPAGWVDLVPSGSGKNVGSRF